MNTKFRWEKMTEDVKAYEDHDPDEEKGLMRNVKTVTMGRFMNVSLMTKNQTKNQPKKIMRKQMVQSLESPKEC